MSFPIQKRSVPVSNWYCPTCGTDVASVEVLAKRHRTCRSDVIWRTRYVTPLADQPVEQCQFDPAEEGVEG